MKNLSNIIISNVPNASIISKFTDLFDIPNDDKEYRISLYILHKLFPKDTNRVEIFIRKEDIALKKAIDKSLCGVILMLPDKRSENLVSILSFINDLSVKKNGKYDKMLEDYLIRSSLDMIFKENTMKVVFKKYFLVGKGKKEKLLHTTFDLTSQDYSCKVNMLFADLLNDLYDALSSRWYKSTIKSLVL